MKISFGTDGFRGIIGKDFTFKNALLAGKKAMNFFKSKGAKRLAIGYDTRFLSFEIAQEMADYAKNAGFDVFISKGFCPTPALSLFTKLMADFGIMITASHNPPIYNGVKIKEKFGGSALSETIKYISQTEPIKTSKIKGKVYQADFFEIYAKFINDIVELDKINSDFRILVNPMFGSSQGWLSEFLADRVKEIREINNFVNPSFNGINPEPMRENLLEMIKLVSVKKYHIGFAFDGDGDRISSIDRNGNYYSSQKIFPIFLNYLVKNKKRKGSVVKTVSTTSMVNRIAQKNRLVVYEVPIGFKNIVPYILSEDVIVAGEESGGIYVNGYIPERDGIFCALFMLYILSMAKKDLALFWQEMEEEYGKYVFKRKDYHFLEGKRLREKIEKIDFESISNLKVKSKNFIDGKKFIFDNGFLLIRLSGTEPVLRVYVEAEKEEKVDEIFYFIEQKLKNLGL